MHTWLHQVCPDATATGMQWTSPTWPWTSCHLWGHLSCSTCLASLCGSVLVCIQVTESQNFVLFNVILVFAYKFPKISIFDVNLKIHYFLCHMEVQRWKHSHDPQGNRICGRFTKRSQTYKQIPK